MAYAVAQHNANAGGVTTLKYAGAQTASNTNFVGVCCQISATPTVADSANGSYTQDGSFASGDGGGAMFIFRRNTIAAAGANTNTVTISGVTAANIYDIWAIEISGFTSGVAAVDATTGTQGLTAPLTFTITPTGADFIFVITALTGGTAGTLTNLTLLDNLNDNDYWWSTSGSGAVVCTITGLTAWGVLAIAYKQSASNINVSGQTGNILVTAPNPLAALGAAAPSGNVLTTGSAPAYAWGASPPQGNVLLSAPQPLAALGIAAPSGSVNVTGPAPKAALGVAAPTGNILISGPSPASAIGVSGSGLINVAGLAPNAALGAAAPAGNIFITGAQPNIILSGGDINVSGQTGNILISAPGPLAAIGVFTPSGLVDVTGLAPNAALGVNALTGGIFTTGSAPNSALGVSALTGAVFVSGAQPNITLSGGGTLNISGLLGQILVSGPEPSIVLGVSLPGFYVILNVFAAYDIMYLPATTVQPLPNLIEIIELAGPYPDWQSAFLALVGARGSVLP